MTLDELPDPRSSLARRTLAWCDRFWDDARGLASAPSGSGFGPVHLVPQTGWYAYGLLLRDEPGDVSRAMRCIESLLALQYDEPGTPWHGTFARFAETPHPPEDAVMWVHFDPNWRQFLGTTFIALLKDFEGRLPEKLRAGIDRALRLAVVGEPEGRVPASYTNIALMKAFLSVEAGTRLGEAHWVRDGEALAAEVADDYRRSGAFEEYNSPTYYGIDFYALALWSVRSSSPRLRELGAELEAALWRDVARWYHAGLRNLCGPYSRSYGIDMHDYVALLGLDIWAAVGEASAPLPPLRDDADHCHDFFLGPLTAALGMRVPQEALPSLERFAGPRSVAQEIAGDAARMATGWLDEDRMIGAERHATDRLSGWAQYVPATLHWRLPDGGVGWTIARSLAAPDATASEGRLDLGWPASEKAGELRLFVHAPGATVASFEPERWELPGISVRVETTLLPPRVEAAGEDFRIVYTRPRSDVAERLQLRLL